MIRVFLATAETGERLVLRRMLIDLKMQIAGEAADWFTTLAKAPSTNFNILLVDWDLLPMNAATGLSELRQACTYAVIVVLTGNLDTLKQAALSAGADAFIRKDEIPNHLAEWLESVTQKIDAKSQRLKNQ